MLRNQYNTWKLTTELPQRRKGEPESLHLWFLLGEGARSCHCCYSCLVQERWLGLVPCFLLSIWSGTEWESVTENTSRPVKAVCEQATFGSHYLLMLSHLAPILLKPAEAVPQQQPAVCTTVPSRCPDRGILHGNKQGQVAWWEWAAGRRVSGREKEFSRPLMSILKYQPGCDFRD